MITGVAGHMNISGNTVPGTPEVTVDMNNEISVFGMEIAAGGMKVFNRTEVETVKISGDHNEITGDRYV